jgi:amidase
MTRTVQDAAILLSVIAGRDTNDPATHTLSVTIDYTKYLDPNGLKDLRIGISRSQKENEETLSKEAVELFENLLKVLSDAGAVLVDNIDVGSNNCIFTILRYEFKACLNHYLSTLQNSTVMKTLNDIIGYNQANASTVLKYGQGLLLQTENNTSGNLTEPEYISALKKREKEVVRLDKLFDENEIDVMLCDTFSNIAPLTGFPSMTIPIGKKENRVPVGSYWIARRFDEAKLIKATYAVEQIMGLCLKPGL